jgi:HEPN domain-containing protein
MTVLLVKRGHDDGEPDGRTPYGIFMLAEAFLQAAHDTFGRSIKITEGPTRLLCYHACELFLQAYLREHGEDDQTFRTYQHDLAAMYNSATAKGLESRSQVVDQLRKASVNKDYVRVRYMVTEDRLEREAEKVLALASAVRECVARSSQSPGIKDRLNPASWPPDR